MACNDTFKVDLLRMNLDFNFKLIQALIHLFDSALISISLNDGQTTLI